MKTLQLIKALTNYQVEVSFIVLGIYFNKNEKIGNKPAKQFQLLHVEGLKALKDIGVELGNEFTVSQIKDLLKVEMLKRGIE